MKKIPDARVDTGLPGIRVKEGAAESDAESKDVALAHAVRSHTPQGRSTSRDADDRNVEAKLRIAPRARARTTPVGFPSRDGKPT